jgi:hypothetical protein
MDYLNVYSVQLPLDVAQKLTHIVAHHVQVLVGVVKCPEFKPDFLTNRRKVCLI